MARSKRSISHIQLQATTWLSLPLLEFRGCPDSFRLGGELIAAALAVALPHPCDYIISHFGEKVNPLFAFLRFAQNDLDQLEIFVHFADGGLRLALIL